MSGPKRVTPKQLAANRRNARLSTGPRTPRGKAVSRWNALKHGILAQAIIPSPLEDYESRHDFDQLLARLQDEFSPASAMEQLLVERIATAYWRIARVLRAEGAAIAQRQDLAAQLRANQTASGALQPPAASNASPADLQRHPALERARSSIPRLYDAIVFSRYELAFEYQIYRALQALERLQRRRDAAPASHAAQ